MQGPNSPVAELLQVQLPRNFGMGLEPPPWALCLTLHNRKPPSHQSGSSHLHPPGRGPVLVHDAQNDDDYDYGDMANEYVNCRLVLDYNEACTNEEDCQDWIVKIKVKIGLLLFSKSK